MLLTDRGSTASSLVGHVVVVGVVEVADVPVVVSMGEDVGLDVWARNCAGSSPATMTAAWIPCPFMMLRCIACYL